MVKTTKIHFADIILFVFVIMIAFSVYNTLNVGASPQEPPRCEDAGLPPAQCSSTQHTSSKVRITAEFLGKLACNHDLGRCKTEVISDCISMCRAQGKIVGSTCGFKIQTSDSKQCTPECTPITHTTGVQVGIGATHTYTVWECDTSGQATLECSCITPEKKAEKEAKK